MNTNLSELKLALQSEDVGQRMKVLPASRSLSPSERLELVYLAVQDANSRIRYDAISQLSSLGEQNPDQTIHILRTALLTDPELDVRSAAADSIGALQFTQLFPELEQVFENTSDWVLQLSVVAALGELGDGRAYPLLVNALGHSNDLIKTAAIGSLGELGNPEAIDVLIPLAKHPDWQLRHRLAQALANLGGDKSQAILQELTSDPDKNVAEIAKSLISK